MNGQLAPQRSRRAGLGANHSVTLTDGGSALVLLDQGGLLTVHLPNGASQIDAVWSGTGSAPTPLVPMSLTGSTPQLVMNNGLGTLTFTWMPAGAAANSFGASASVTFEPNLAPVHVQPQPKTGAKPPTGGGTTGLSLSLSGMSTGKKVAIIGGGAAALAAVGYVGYRFMKKGKRR